MTRNLIYKALNLQTLTWEETRSQFVMRQKIMLVSIIKDSCRAAKPDMPYRTAAGQVARQDGQVGRTTVGELAGPGTK